ncbi:hypothetical protein BC826DRAFT_982338 [Russula brevipes]|nr:hypothetical protein BC826DRAFT_982338 [Russula brevipes]
MLAAKPFPDYPTFPHHPLLLPPWRGLGMHQRTRPTTPMRTRPVRDATETCNMLEFDGCNMHCKDVVCPHGRQDWHEHRDTCTVCGLALRVLTRRNRLDEARQGEEKQAKHKRG